MFSDTVSDIKKIETLIDIVEILQNPPPLQPTTTKERSCGTA